MKPHKPQEAVEKELRDADRAGDTAGVHDDDEAGAAHCAPCGELSQCSSLSLFIWRFTEPYSKLQGLRGPSEALASSECRTQRRGMRPELGRKRVVRAKNLQLMTTCTMSGSKNHQAQLNCGTGCRSARLSCC
jgi:hypothetical protein